MEFSNRGYRDTNTGEYHMIEGNTGYSTPAEAGAKVNSIIDHYVHHGGWEIELNGDEDLVIEDPRTGTFAAKVPLKKPADFYERQPYGLGQKDYIETQTFSGCYSEDDAKATAKRHADFFLQSGWQMIGSVKAFQTGKNQWTGYVTLKKPAEYDRGGRNGR